MRRIAPFARWLAAAMVSTTLIGCGTTRWSDTQRTATEQLLISNAVDKAISEFDFTSLAEKEVYFDPQYLKGAIDENYVISSLRQQLLASGCVLRETRDEAEYVVEARSGGIGTDRSDLLFGVPSVSVPSVPGVPLPSSIPELPFAKSTKQKAIAKIALFAYNRKTGRPLMQSGTDTASSMARNSWFFGAGPFQRGAVYERTSVAGDGLPIPIIGGRREDRSQGPSIAVTQGAVFREYVAEANGTTVRLAGGGVAAPSYPVRDEPASRVARGPASPSPRGGVWALNQGLALPRTQAATSKPAPAKAAPSPTPAPAASAPPAASSTSGGATSGVSSSNSPLPDLLKLWESTPLVHPPTPSAKPAAGS